MILLSLVILNSFSCNRKYKNSFDFLAKDIDKVILVDRQRNKYQLPTESQKHFISYLQKTDDIEFRKVFVCYKVFFYLKNDKMKIYKTNGRLIAEMGGDIFHNTAEVTTQVAYL